MIETLKNFQLTIKQQGHVLPLLERVNIRLNLVCEQKNIQIIIRNGEVLSIFDSEPADTLPEIRGDLQAMKQLLEGKERLRALERSGQISITASLRTTLLLESIFYLTKAQENFATARNF
ncbi:hypothetical protein [Neobacillus drentensis]|uniref:hypothetical protein n=1 Tax=Neobacillus drentensis TaxID=220684 RepID=UPI002FFD5912